jgi:hypothetical protein
MKHVKLFEDFSGGQEPKYNWSHTGDMVELSKILIFRYDEQINGEYNKKESSDPFVIYNASDKKILLDEALKRADLKVLGSSDTSDPKTKYYVSDIIRKMKDEKGAYLVYGDEIPDYLFGIHKRSGNIIFIFVSGKDGSDIDISGPSLPSITRAAITAIASSYGDMELDPLSNKFILRPSIFDKKRMDGSYTEDVDDNDDEEFTMTNKFNF